MSHPFHVRWWLDHFQKGMPDSELERLRQHDKAATDLSVDQQVEIGRLEEIRRLGAERIIRAEDEIERLQAELKETQLVAHAGIWLCEYHRPEYRALGAEVKRLRAWKAEAETFMANSLEQWDADQKTIERLRAALEHDCAECRTHWCPERETLRDAALAGHKPAREDADLPEWDTPGTPVDPELGRTKPRYSGEDSEIGNADDRR